VGNKIFIIQSVKDKKENGDDRLPIPTYKIYNIGNSNPKNLLDFVQILSKELVITGVFQRISILNLTKTSHNAKR